jgi:carbonic anhydrase/acetyltransferase-like protein (isoleucine patch superfamily)
VKKPLFLGVFCSPSARESFRILRLAGLACAVCGSFRGRPAAVGVAEADRSGPGCAAGAGRGREGSGGRALEGAIWLHPSVKLPATATIIGPAWIGANTEIRPGAFIRGNVIVGAGAVLGNACEFKNCLLMDKVQVPHFSYVGDSILGNGAHLGAGVICSNLRLDQKPVVIRAAGVTHETGLKKFGAVLGDRAEVGCNAVLNPGTLLGPVPWWRPRCRSPATCPPPRSRTCAPRSR